MCLLKSVNMMSHAIIAWINVMVWPVHVIAYSNTGGTATSFPHDIPHDAAKISFKFTTVTVIYYIEYFPNLKELYLGENALVEFPDLSNVTSSLEILFISNNDISRINYIPVMSALRILAVEGNSLSHLPDLTNVSETLQRLFLGNNNILEINGIAPMTNLKILNLRNNSMTNCPDVRNAGGSLTNLILFDNGITRIPDDLIAPLVKLKRLALGSSSGESVTLPNVCVMGRSADILTIEMYTEYITCDWEAVHAKLAVLTGRLMISPVGVSATKCTSPASLVDRIFSEVTTNDLIHDTRKFIITYITQMQPFVYAPLLVYCAKSTYNL